MPSAETKHIREYFGVRTLLASHPDMRRLKRMSKSTELHGNKLWGSAYLLIDYLQENPLPAASKVLDLGCGWGLASIYCAKYMDATVTGVDADTAVFPYLSLMASHNHVHIDTFCAHFDELSIDTLGQYDVVIASDVCFWDEMSQSVFDLIQRAISANIKKIIITDPHRPPFIAVAEACIDEYFAELTPRDVITNRRHQGSVLVIENA